MAVAKTAGNSILATDFRDSSNGAAGIIPVTETGGKLNSDFMPDVAAEVDMVMPMFNGLDIDDVAILGATTTRADFMRFTLRAKIAANKITIYNNSGSWTLKVGIYSADGQTLLMEEDIVSTAAGNETHTLGTELELLPGDYYLAAVVVSGSPSVYGYKRGLYTKLWDGVTSKPVVLGYATVTASTLPTTFDPTTITAIGVNGYGGVQFRLDN